MKRLLLFSVLLLLLFANVSAQYISGEIYLYENGEARFNLETDQIIQAEGLTFNNNKVTGRTNFFSTLEKGEWSFNLNEGFYDSIFLEIQLPSNIQSISSIEGLENNLILDEKTIIVATNDENLELKINYTLEKKTNLFILYFIIFILVIFGLGYILFKIISKKKKLENILPFINDQEKKIIDELMKGKVRQKELREKLNIPKGSFTRYIVNLEKKRMIKRVGEGKNKFVVLN